jgi:hypothetical protein
VSRVAGGKSDGPLNQIEGVLRVDQMQFRRVRLFDKARMQRLGIEHELLVNARKSTAVLSSIACWLRRRYAHAARVPFQLRVRQDQLCMR